MDNDTGSLDGIAIDGTNWRQGLPSGYNGRQPGHNIFSGLPGSIRRGLNPENEREAFLVFVDVIVERCIMYTNLQGRRSTSKNNQQNTTTQSWKKTDRLEMEAFFGLLLLAGAYKAHYRSTEELWSETEGHPVFRATMSRTRFCALKVNLRFDDPLRRDDTDPLAPIRDISNEFIVSLKSHVTAPEYLCIDEQLLEFHGRVRFRQYIPSKPGKFGIKIFWLTDSQGQYCFNGLIYSGAGTISDSERGESSSYAEAVVMKLMQPFLNNGRNITGYSMYKCHVYNEKKSLCLREDETLHLSVVYWLSAGS